MVALTQPSIHPRQAATMREPKLFTTQRIRERMGGGKKEEKARNVFLHFKLSLQQLTFPSMLISE